MTGALIDSSFMIQRGPLAVQLDFPVHDGETVAIVGPNGAGKTTVLRAIAGLDAIDSGHITIDNAVVDAPDQRTFVQPEDRPVSLVFQDHRLFPHLSAAQNIAFARQSRRTGRSGKEQTTDLLDLVGLDPKVVGPQRGDQLSGGQRQRVAIARALASNPRVLLLDEPFAAVDGSAQAELRRVIRSLDLPIVLVTHDALDARLLADTLVVMENGSAIQRGTPQAVSDFPSSAWTATLLGQNLVAGVATGTQVTSEHGVILTTAEAMSGNVVVSFAPSGVTLSRGAPDGSARNVWRTRVHEVASVGDRVRIRLDMPLPCWVTVTPASVDRLGLIPGQEVTASVKATDLRVQPS